MISDRAKRLVEAVLATEDHYEAQEIAQRYLDDAEQDGFEDGRDIPRSQKETGD